jgi:hypothetical protein
MGSLPRSPEEHRRWWERNTDLPYGTCWCGCGERTSLAKANRYTVSAVKGAPRRYVRGHSGLFRGPYYVEEDRGYETPCWVWRRGTDQDGYAQTCVSKKTRRAARVYYERFRGPIPQGLDIDHLCRVRSCVNPHHLEPVTRTENTRRGNMAKLSCAKAKRIRELLRGGATASAVAEMFGVHSRTIRDVRNGKSWRQDEREWGAPS